MLPINTTNPSDLKSKNLLVQASHGSLPAARVVQKLEMAGHFLADLHLRHSIQRRRLHLSMFALVAFGLVSLQVFRSKVEVVTLHSRSAIRRAGSDVDSSSIPMNAINILNTTSTSSNRQIAPETAGHDPFQSTVDSLIVINATSAVNGQLVESAISDNHTTNRPVVWVYESESQQIVNETTLPAPLHPTRASSEAVDLILFVPEATTPAPLQELEGAVDQRLFVPKATTQAPPHGFDEVVDLRQLIPDATTPVPLRTVDQLVDRQQGVPEATTPGPFRRSEGAVDHKQLVPAQATTPAPLPSFDQVIDHKLKSNLPASTDPTESTKNFVHDLSLQQRATLSQHEPSIRTHPVPVPTFSPPLITQSPQFCWNERDFGIIRQLQTSQRDFCQRQQQQQKLLANEPTTTSIAFFKYPPADLQATVFQNLEIDLRSTQVSRPILDLSQDGGNHDPRFQFHNHLIKCECAEVLHELVAYALLDVAAQRQRKPINFWTSIFAQQNDPFERSSHCLKDSISPPEPALQSGQSPNAVFNVPLPVFEHTNAAPMDADSSASLVEFTEKVVLIARRDDHNPFFQVSATLNAWILLQVAAWDVKTTRLVQLDAGFGTPTDGLQQRMLAPSMPLVRGSTLLGKRVRFLNQVLVAPFETTGPLMQHLDDFEPCFRNDLILKFRQEAMNAFGVSSDPHQPNAADTCVVTIISRRAYRGRNVQRKWLNEDEIVNEMRAVYGESSPIPHEGVGQTDPIGTGGATSRATKCVFQSVDFVDLTMEQQMSTIQSSDVVIGMHGAGMVNVLWTRPGTLVVEIFPRYRRRWGFRNLCQFVGCDYHEFRGGKDTGRGDNASDKTIPWYHWQAFFDPLLQRVLTSKRSNEMDDIEAPK